MDQGQVAQSQKRSGRSRRARFGALSRADLQDLENLSGIKRFVRIGWLVIRGV